MAAPKLGPAGGQKINSGEQRVQVEVRNVRKCFIDNYSWMLHSQLEYLGARFGGHE